MVSILVAASRVALQDAVAKAVATDAQFQIVGVARDGKEAVRSAMELRPDIVVIGSGLQKQDGVETTREIMIVVPTPIVFVAIRSDAAAGDITVDALDAGALAVIPAPDERERDSAAKFLARLMAMSQVKVVRQWRDRARPEATSCAKEVPAKSLTRIVAIAASTGGPGALRTLLKDLPASFPAPILAVQHISSGFIEGVAKWLDGLVPLKVKLARNGEILRAGTVYLAPDGHHLGVASRTRILVVDALPVKGFKPSGTYLFDSVARVFGHEALAVVLTGMGDDGIDGLRPLHDAGGCVIAQDEDSAVVFGMPKAAVEAGLADRVLPLQSIARELVTRTGQ